MTIIRNLGAYIDHEYIALGADVRATLEDSIKQLKKYKAIKARRGLKLLECFLQITRQTLTKATLYSADMEPLSERFVGAIYSPDFMDALLINRWEYASTYLDLINHVRMIGCTSRCTIIIPMASLRTTPNVDNCVKLFSAMTKDKERVILWKAWPSINQKGQTTWLRLYHINKRLGADFTVRIYAILDHHFSNRRLQKISGIEVLGRFIAQFPDELNEFNFQSSSFMTTFVKEFFKFYLADGYKNGQGSSIEYLVTEWKQSICVVLEKLIKSEVFAPVYGVLPTPRSRSIRGALTNIRISDSGKHIKEKLLTSIPLEVADGVAMELLVQSIRRDYEVIVEWAEFETSYMWRRYQQRKELEVTGSVRLVQPIGGCDGSSWLNNIKNSEYVANGAATFAFHGYQTQRDVTLKLLYVQPLEQAAFDLALPTRLDLLPHCILLIVNHPCLTEAALVDLKLYDATGNMSGFIETDAGWTLVTYKPRKGAELAQMNILLTYEAAELVKRIILITQPLRDYLRARNDGNWRYLLLSCGKSFGYPKRVKFGIPAKDQSLFFELAEGIGIATDVSQDYAKRLLNKLTLSAVRATAGVMTFFETGSVTEMSKALGHAEYNSDLLSRYLPESIRSYFEERSIRIFQQGIVVEAMKESELLLEASDFRSMSELELFLENHGLRRLSELLTFEAKAAISSESLQGKAGHEIMFSVNAVVLEALISIYLAVKNATKTVNSKAQYWSEVAERLVNYIEHGAQDRPDLYDHLLVARKKANPQLMELAIYG